MAEAVVEMTKRGWASFEGTLDDVTAHARNARWEPVAMRRGDPTVVNICAVASADARPNSISSRTGMAAQRLHTDGAHMKTPPDVVALVSTCSHRAATRLRRLDDTNAPWDDLRHGVFRVSDGRVRRYLCAANGDAIRFDPYCMIPLDGRSRSVVRFFATVFDMAVRHQWARDTAEVLLIDNWRTLHAREAVDPAGPPRHLTRIAFRRPEVS